MKPKLVHPENIDITPWVQAMHTVSEQIEMLVVTVDYNFRDSSGNTNFALNKYKKRRTRNISGIDPYINQSLNEVDSFNELSENDLRCSVPGVYWDKRSWIASWYQEGKRHYRSFSAKTHGFNRAKLAAIQIRTEKVREHARSRIGPRRKKIDKGKN